MRFILNVVADLLRILRHRLQTRQRRKVRDPLPEIAECRAPAPASLVQINVSLRLVAVN
jgi:hypothetical protein